MINSVNYSWVQFQSTARFVLPADVADSNDKFALSGLDAQPAFTIGIAQRDEREQPEITLGTKQADSQEQPAITLGANQFAQQEQPEVTIGVNQLAPQEQKGVSDSDDKSASPGLATQPAAKPGVNQLDPQLTPQEQREVEKLKQRDQEVRAHEQAHKAQLGPYATGGPYYEYQTGPDKKMYAVGGSVGVDTSKESTPEKTIQKAQTIKRASMAVSNPSSADKAVASKAQQMEQKARAELVEKKQQERRDISRELGLYQQADPANTVAQSVDIIA